MDAFVISSLPSRLKETLQSSRALSLHGRYSASSLLRAHPPPSRLRSTSRFSRLYDLPCSGDFAPGRGGLRQFLGMSLSPCCRFHPAEVAMPRRSDFGIPCCLRPSDAGSALGSSHFRGHIYVHCRYGPATRGLPKGDLVDGLQDFRILVSRHPAIQTTGLLTFALAGLSPAGHTSLYWSQHTDMTLSCHPAPIRQTYRSCQVANARRDSHFPVPTFAESGPRESYGL